MKPFSPRDTTIPFILGSSFFSGSAFLAVSAFLVADAFSSPFAGRVIRTGAFFGVVFGGVSFGTSAVSSGAGVGVVGCAKPGAAIVSEQTSARRIFIGQTYESRPQRQAG